MGWVCGVPPKGWCACGGVPSAPFVPIIEFEIISSSIVSFNACTAAALPLFCYRERGALVIGCII